MISKKMLSKKRKKQFYSIVRNVRDSKHFKFKLAVSVPPNVDVSSKSTKLPAVYAYLFILGSHVFPANPCSVICKFNQLEYTVPPPH